MTRYRGYHTWLKEYIEILKRRELSRGYIRRNEIILKKIYHWLKDGGRTTYPKRITFDDVIYIRDQIPLSTQENRSCRNRRHCIDFFRNFLRFCGNFIPPPAWPQYFPNKPRNTPEEFDIIMQKFNENVVLDFGLITGYIMVILSSLTIRRIGQLRLRVENIHENYIYVLDKGRCGGKPRIIPLDRETKVLLNQYLDLRAGAINYCLSIHPEQEKPTEFLIWYHANGCMGSIKRNSYDKTMNRISEFCGIKVTAHRLRRYACTELKKLKVDTAVAMKISGHSTEQQFLNYCDLFDDELEAVEKMMQHKKARFSKRLEEYRLVNLNK